MGRARGPNPRAWPRLRARHLLLVQPRVDYLTLLGVSFLTYEMGMILLVPTWVVGKMKLMPGTTVLSALGRDCDH